MQLTVWTYEGPPHVGAMRIATALKDVHYVLHAPQGDTYADLLFTMIERRDHRPPVTYTTFKARDLGADTAEILQSSIAAAYERHQPSAMLVGASCTAELLQDDPEGLSKALKLPIPVIPLELPSYQRKENWGASETFYRLVRALTARVTRPDKTREETSATSATSSPPATCNILGPTALGFRHRDDLTEITRLLTLLGVQINVVAPDSASVQDIMRLPDADFNVVLYPEIASPVASLLKKNFDQPHTSIVPIGVGATRDFISEVAELANIDASEILAQESARLPWYSRSIDSNYLTGKRVFIFGDATHVLAGARVAREEMGFDVIGLGTYSREFARDVRALAKTLGIEPLITDDYLEVESAIIAAQPELILGTQMERHIAKRLRIPCAVISAPVHVQDYPARYSPQMGFEGANVLFDTWVHPLLMGLEEHLITMFRDDFEFHDDAGASHLGAAAKVASEPTEMAKGSEVSDTATGEPVIETQLDGASAHGVAWMTEAEQELKKIPFFVRGKARRNTEKFAAQNGLQQISLDTLYEAKAHYAR